MNTVDLLRYHRSMVTDTVRLERFRKAVESCVKAGDVVLDLGSGTGVLAVLAARAGARLVYAVEATEIVEIARGVCRENRVEDRVVFLDDLSPRVSVPEPADVLITETIGNFGLDEGILGWVRDARRRFLKDDALVVPASIELFAVPVEVSDIYGRNIDWEYEQAGIDLHPMRRFAVNNLYRERIRPDDFLARPHSLGEVLLDETFSTTFSARVHFEVSRDGTLHGLGGWFSSQLCEGVAVSNDPQSDPGSWSHAILPIEKPLSVNAGDRLNVHISCTSNGSVWRWGITVQSRQTEADGARSATSRFEHSTFFGAPGMASHFHRRAANHAPGRNSDGNLLLYVLSSMSGEHTLEDLSVRVADEFPDRFADSAEALEYVREVSVVFGT